MHDGRKEGSDMPYRFFGKPGSAYDFQANDMNQMREKARELEEQQKGMKKKVNPKVLHTIDTCVLISS